MPAWWIIKSGMSVDLYLLYIFSDSIQADNRYFVQCALFEIYIYSAVH